MRYLIIFFLLCFSCQVVKVAPALQKSINENNKGLPCATKMQDEIMLSVYGDLIEMGYGDSIANKAAIRASVAVVLEIKPCS